MFALVVVMMILWCLYLLVCIAKKCMHGLEKLHILPAVLLENELIFKGEIGF